MLRIRINGFSPLGSLDCFFVCCCLLFLYVLKSSMVISGWVLACESVHSCWNNSAVPLGNQVSSTMIWYPTQSHYPTVVAILILLNAWLWSNRYTFLSHQFWLNQGSNAQGSDSPISQNGRQTLYSFGHPMWSFWLDNSDSDGREKWQTDSRDMRYTFKMWL